MAQNKRAKPSPALVISLIALFVALGSGAYAASKIRTKDIKDEAVTGKKLAKNAVKSSKTKDGGLKGKDLKDETISESKIGKDAVSTGKIADDAVSKEKVSSDIPYRRTLTSTFTAGADYQTLVSFGDAELQGRCNTAGANGFMQLRVISPNNGAQADMTATGPTSPIDQNSGQLGPNVGLEITTLALGNFNSPGVGSARVAARAPDGTPLIATVGSHSLGGGDCVFNAMAL